MLDVVKVLQRVGRAGGAEVGERLGEGGGRGAAAVEDGEVAAVEGLVGVVCVALHVAVAAEGPGCGVGAAAVEILFEGRVQDGLGWLRGAGCGWGSGG